MTDRVRREVRITYAMLAVIFVLSVATLGATVTTASSRNVARQAELGRLVDNLAVIQECIVGTVATASDGQELTEELLRDLCPPIVVEDVAGALDQ